jgi:hypothetical protein
MFEEYETFILSKTISDESDIKPGIKGVVLMVYSNMPPTYEVEFLDENGNNIRSKLTYTLTKEFMKKIQL